MSITSNDTSAFAPGGAAPSADKPANPSPFNATPSAPGGAFGGGLMGRIREFNPTVIDPSVEPYLKTIVETLPNALGSKDAKVSIISLARTRSTYVVDAQAGGYHNLTILSFVSAGDAIDPNLRPASTRLRTAQEEIAEMYKDARYNLLDGRILMSSNPAEMEKAPIMVNTIARTINFHLAERTDPLTVSGVAGAEISLSWDLAAALAYVRRISPHAVPARMDVAAVLSIRPKTNGPTFDGTEAEPQPFCVIGGYTEIGAPEMTPVPGSLGMMVPKYPVIFHITTCLTESPVEGISLLAMSSFIPSLIRNARWLSQWSDGVGDSNRQLALLNENPARRGYPMDPLKTTEDVRAFVSEQFGELRIAIDSLEGKDPMPGMWPLFSDDPSDRRQFVTNVGRFLELSAEQGAENNQLASQLPLTIGGVFGRSDGTMADAACVDILYVTNTLGFAAVTPEIRSAMMVPNQDPVHKARVISTVTGSFVPLWLKRSALLDGHFFETVNAAFERAGVSPIDKTDRGAALSYSQLAGGLGGFNNVRPIVSNGYRMDNSRFAYNLRY